MNYVTSRRNDGERWGGYKYKGGGSLQKVKYGGGGYMSSNKYSHNKYNKMETKNFISQVTYAVTKTTKKGTKM